MTSTLLRQPPPPRQHPTAWWQRAACDGQNPDWWTYSSRAVTPQNEYAQRVCRTCPVRRDCLVEAYRRKDVGTYRAGHRMPNAPEDWRLEPHGRRLTRMALRILDERRQQR